MPFPQRPVLHLVEIYRQGVKNVVPDDDQGVFDTPGGEGDFCSSEFEMVVSEEVKNCGIEQTTFEVFMKSVV